MTIESKPMIHEKFLAVLATAAFVLCTSPALAHPGGHDHDEPHHPQASRTWTLATEGAHLHGAFVAAKDGKVQIRRDDGALATLAMDRLVPSDQKWITERLEEIKRLNTQQGSQLVAQKQPHPPAGKGTTKEQPAPMMLKYFKPFEKTLQLRWDEKYFYVGSNGLPAHPMMVGIRSWQQQVPIPQKYFGDNAWRIPLHPTPAREPMSAKNNFLRGAIALAVNGVPIFNPLNNRGDDAYLFGELDQYGGHCGRADDYHYHLAPVHLEKTTGKDQPIAYALDGYPIFGYQDEQAPDFAPLDWLNGHKDKAGNYHYHATKTYPYLNGGFYGEVTERDGQVDPQPRAEPLRPDLPPLRDAKIIRFEQTEPSSYRLTYEVRGKAGTVSYTLAADGTARFVFVDPSGKTVNETYSPRQPGPGKDDRPRPGDRPERRPPPRREPAAQSPRGAAANRESDLPRLPVTSASVTPQGRLSIDCTCDGAGQSPAIAWKDAPAGTKSFAVSIWHTAPDQEKSYWVVVNIPADVSQLVQNSKGVGQIGLNDKRRAEYDPMCSKGPGVKIYHVTVFALSAEPKLAAGKATRAQLLEAIQDITLAAGTLDFQYERK
ncbi:YHYH protein [Lignipirellula cremea]|nr:YHYH protein [Lignipirellula cremea]